MIPESKREIAEEWVRRLESGQYEQCQGTLHRVEALKRSESKGYCCLGVLTEIAVEKGIVEENGHDSYGETEYLYIDKSGEEHYFSAEPPPVLYEWAGFPAASAIYVDAALPSVDDEDDLDIEEREINVISLNDTFGWTFPQIAAAIRERYNIPKTDGAA